MPSYKVTYFDFPGRAEPIRLLFSYGKIPFEDNRISREDWLKLKPNTPFGQVPLLEIDGETVAQTGAICNYVASLAGLTGKDDKERLAIDVVLFALEDLNTAGSNMRQVSDEKKEEIKQKFNEKLEITLKKFEADTKKNGGFLAINRISMADVMLVAYYEFLCFITGSDALSGYPNLQQVLKNVLAVEGIKEYIKKRPASPQMMKIDLKQFV